MTERPGRTPTGAAVLQHRITSAIEDAVLRELAAQGYSRLAMEAVAKDAGVSKSALYRRWPSKQEMVTAVLSKISLPSTEPPDTGSLRGDLLETLRAVQDWLSDPRFATLLTDLTAEALRNPDLAPVTDSLCSPRRALGAATFHRAVNRGELPPDLDLDLALDLAAAPIYWRLIIRRAPAEPGYLEQLADHILRALAARPTEIA
ncbi:TetR/AcrR family transcriptional regulator [Nocardia carnea]|uniref:TetR/AcrR family transcriptional regulator n=1 Tax=Nocardia carnea TaxID=37328 RepID=UPI002454B554|nr:TetR/AcrR family transcriptional regulator [Nocardia carnea]